LTDETDEALGEFFNSFVESLARGVAIGSKDMVLGFHDTGKCAHEDASFAGEVAVDLILEGSGEKVAGTDGDTESEDTLQSVTGGILEDSEAAVDAAAVEEVFTDAGSGAFRGDEDDIDEIRGDDGGLVVVDDGEAVREVEGIAGVEMRFDLRPHQHLTGVRDEVLDDSAALSSVGEREEGNTRDPAIVEGFIPVRGALVLTDDNVNAVIPHVEGLSGALYTVTKDGDGFIGEDVLGVGKGELITGDDLFFDVAKK
jgi:hypothetical protein